MAFSHECVQRMSVSSGFFYYKDTNPIVSGSHPYDLINLNYFFIPNIATLVLGLQYINWGDTNIYYITTYY